MCVGHLRAGPALERSACVADLQIDLEPSPGLLFHAARDPGQEAFAHPLAMKGRRADQAEAAGVLLDGQRSQPGIQAESGGVGSESAQNAVPERRGGRHAFHTSLYN